MNKLIMLTILFLSSSCVAWEEYDWESGFMKDRYPKEEVKKEINDE